MVGMPCAVNHIAITMPTRESMVGGISPTLQGKVSNFDAGSSTAWRTAFNIHIPTDKGVEVRLRPCPRCLWRGDIK